MKKEKSFPPEADHGRKMRAAGLFCQRFFFFFLRKYEMADKDSHSNDLSVSGGEGSGPLRVATEARARRVLQHQSCCDMMVTSEVSYLGELHVIPVVVSKIPYCLG